MLGTLFACLGLCLLDRRYGPFYSRLQATSPRQAPPWPPATTSGWSSCSSTRCTATSTLFQPIIYVFLMRHGCNPISQLHAIPRPPCAMLYPCAHTSEMLIGACDPMVTQRTGVPPTQARQPLQVQEVPGALGPCHQRAVAPRQLQADLDRRCGHNDCGLALHQVCATVLWLCCGGVSVAVL